MKENRQWVISYVYYIKNKGEGKAYYIVSRTDKKRLDIDLAIKNIKENTSEKVDGILEEIVITNIWENI
jgi:hypothetical protein